MNAISSIFNSTSIGAHVVHVTPELAAQILKDHNHSNRKIRPGVVNKYARQMANGDWKVTPETICVSVTGRLLQGQHRLLAIIKSGASCNFLFATGFADDVFDVLDRGAGRTTADALGIPQKLAEVSKILATISIGTSNLVSDADTRRASCALAAQHAALMDHCSVTAKLFSSAPMRLAAIAHVMGGADPDYVFGLYRALALGNTNNLPPIGHLFIKSFLTGTLDAAISVGGTGGGGRQRNLLSVAWALYDPEQTNRKRISFTRNEASIAKLIKATGYEA